MITTVNPKGQVTIPELGLAVLFLLVCSSASEYLHHHRLGDSQRSVIGGELRRPLLA